MKFIPRALLAIGWMAGACACASKPLPEARGMQERALVHEFSGGPKTPEIEAKKTHLLAEYQVLEQAESELDKKRILLMSQVTEDVCTNDSRFAQANRFSKSGARLTEQQEIIANLEHELTAAGVTITAHR